jgi:elongation factor G
LLLTTPDRVHVVTGVGHAAQTRAIAERLGITSTIVEPSARDTAPALCLATTLIWRSEPEALIISTPADHIIETHGGHWADTMSTMLKAAHGGEYGTRRMMEVAKARGLCRVLVVNKIDAEPGKLAALIASLREEFGPECLPINLPAKNGAAVVDCFFQPSGEADFSSVGDAHQHIIDQVVEINETVMGHYLDDGESGLSGQELHDAFEQCLREGHLVPICFVSGRTGVRDHRRARRRETHHEDAHQSSTPGMRMKSA